MIAAPNSNDHDELSQKAEKMKQLVTLIQEYPAETQLIMAAVEDGLTLGPAHILDAAPPRQELAGLPSPDPAWLEPAEAGSGSD